MRVAALYDIHGNLPALEAVLDEVPGDATLLVGGDIAAGPMPAETIGRLRPLEDRVVSEIRVSGYPDPDDLIELLVKPPSAREAAEHFERQALEQVS